MVAIHGVDWAAYDNEIIPIGAQGECNLMDAYVCGFLVHEDKEKIVLAREVYSDHYFEAVIVINKKTIKERVQHG